MNKTKLSGHTPIDWKAYEKRVRALEAEGMTRSDAQGVVDLEPEFRQ